MQTKEPVVGISLVSVRDLFYLLYMQNQFDKYIFKNSQSGNVLAININFWTKFFISSELTPLGMSVTFSERGWVWIFLEPHIV